MIKSTSNVKTLPRKTGGPQWSVPAVLILLSLISVRLLAATPEQHLASPTRHGNPGDSPDPGIHPFGPTNELARALFMGSA